MSFFSNSDSSGLSTLSHTMRQVLFNGSIRLSCWRSWLLLLLMMMMVMMVMMMVVMMMLMMMRVVILMAMELVVLVDDDEDEDDDDDDDDDDNDDGDYIAFASLVEGGVGADIYVCLELTCLLWCFYRNNLNCNHSLMPCSNQGRGLLTSLEELTYLLHAALRLARKSIKKSITVAKSKQEGRK